MKKAMFVAVAVLTMGVQFGCGWDIAHKVIFHLAEVIQTWGALDQVGIV